MVSLSNGTYNITTAYHENSTITLSQDTADEVTGQVAFWAMIALALNAMAQSSTTTDLFFGSEGLFRAGFIPQMSSPIVCLSDVLIESALVLLCAWQRICEAIGWRTSLDPSSDETLPSIQAAEQAASGLRELLGVRLVLFLFAVLPQAIKVFSMQGVPWLQAVAAVLIAAPVVRTVTILVGTRCEDLKRAFRRWAVVVAPGGPEQVQAPGSRTRLAARGVRIALRLLHFAGYIVLWYQVHQRITSHAAPLVLDLLRLFYWIFAAGAAIAALASIIWLIGCFFIGEWMTRWPSASPMPFLMVLSLFSTSFSATMKSTDTLTSEDDERSLDDVDVYTTICHTLPLILVASLCCALIEAVIYRLSRLIWKSKAHGSDGASDDIQLNPISNETPQAEHRGQPGAAIQYRSSFSLRSWIEVFPKINHHTLDNDDQIFGRWRSEEDAIDKMSACGATTLVIFAGLLLSSMGSANNPEKANKPSMAFGGWVVIAMCFSAFRTLIPPALWQAWSSGKACLRWQDRLKQFAGVLKIVILLFAAQMVVYSLCALHNLFQVDPHTRFLRRKTEYLKERRGWNCFAIFNLMTVAIYFFFVFDGTGTVNPPWTDFLG